MASNRSQSVKRLTCCNILGSEIPFGIKVSFEIIVGEILSNYSSQLCLKVFDSAQST